MKNSKNYTIKIRNYISSILGDITLSEKQYENVWKEFVNNFEKSERIIIVNEIIRIINETYKNSKMKYK